MLSAQQPGKYWYHFFNIFGMTPPLLGIEPGTYWTLPLGYRGGWKNIFKFVVH